MTDNYWFTLGGREHRCEQHRDSMRIAEQLERIAVALEQISINLKPRDVADAPATPKDEPVDENLLRTIDSLELSVRTSNCLKCKNICFVGELVQLTEKEFLRIKNIGRKSLNEIKEVLGWMGLTLGMRIKFTPPT